MQISLVPMQEMNPSPVLTLTLGATIVTWLPQIDLALRIGASVVAIVSGVLCAIYYVRKIWLGA